MKDNFEWVIFVVLPIQRILTWKFGNRVLGMYLSYFGTINTYFAEGSELSTNTLVLTLAVCSFTIGETFVLPFLSSVSGVWLSATSFTCSGNGRLPCTFFMGTVVSGMLPLTLCILSHRIFRFFVVTFR